MWGYTGLYRGIYRDSGLTAWDLGFKVQGLSFRSG